MKFTEKTAVGIDISEERISIAMLRAGKNGIELVKSDSIAMPDGAVSDGNITDPILLAKTIKELKHRCKIRQANTAVSAFAKPVVVQFIDMPKQIPTNIRQYVQSEVRNCVALPSRDVVIDFCPVGTAKRTTGSANSAHAEKRVLAVAAEETKMLELVRICGKEGLHIEAIEPALFAYMRGLYSQKVAGKNALNVLMAILRGTSLTLCVFKNGFVDFIRTKEIPKSVSNTAELNQWLTEELSNVVRFYDIEVPDNAGKWDVTLFLDNQQSAQDVEKVLKTVITTGHLQIRTIEDACLDTPVSNSLAEKGEKPSPVAVGLAMRLLTAQSHDLKINLVPHRVIKTREVKRDALVAVNIIALVLFVMVLAINAFVFIAGRVNRAVVVKKQLVANEDTEKMLEQQEQFDGRLNILSARVDKMTQISSSHNDVNWIEVLESIKNATPGSVLITSISCQDGIRINVEGLAMSNEAVNLFVGLLEKTHCISSVTLLEARKQDGQKQLITYQLSCKLANRSVKTQNVG